MVRKTFWGTVEIDNNPYSNSFLSRDLNAHNSILFSNEIETISIACGGLVGGTGGSDDFDGDGICNDIDLDDDNDGILDVDENCVNTGMLTYEFYNVLPSGNTVDNIPTTGADNIALTSDFDVIAIQVANSPGDITEYAIRFTGDIFIANSDTYTFYLGSDDGSKLFINDVEIVDHDGAHPYSERSGSVTLNSGYHNIRVAYFENSGGRQLTLKYASLANPSIIPVPFSILVTNTVGCSSTATASNNTFNLDADNDGIPDIIEAGGIDIDNDGQVDGTFVDTDGDGWADTFDPDNGGTPLPLPDTDGDGIADRIDLDSDNDGIPDIIETGGTDSNGDGIVDGVFTDTDLDGWSNVFDSDNGGSPLSYDDLDGDGLDNRLDLDSDNDGIPDIREAGGTDTDGDGQVDGAITDTDNDGWADAFDADNGGSALTYPDTDGDLIPNTIDLDSDNDGIPDNIEFQPTETYIEFSANDTDGDGINDAYDIDNGGTALLSPFNKDGTDNPDYLDLDSDNDAVFDIDESTGLLTDSNNDGKTDGTVGQNGLDNLHGPDNFTNPNGILGGANQINSFLDLDNDYLTCATGGLDYRDAIGDDSCFGPTDDYDGDGVNNGNDLDDDNDGILDSDEHCIVNNTLTYEFYNMLPAGNTVDNIPTTGADNIALTSDFDVIALQVASSPGDVSDYSIRFRGDILLDNSDTYTFYLGSDDGSKLYIDGIEVVDHDGPHSFSEKSGSVVLSAGYHDLKIEYFEISGNRQLTLQYESLSSPTKITVPFSILRGKSYGCATSGVGNANQFNLDADNDGIPDIVEAGGIDIDNDGQVDGTFVDTDGDGWADTFDPDNGGTPLLLPDTDGDGIADQIDLDSDNDGIPDIIETGGTDSNGDGIVDGVFTDTDLDGWSDVFDSDNGGSPLSYDDLDTDGLDNRLDLDSDNDGIPDIQEAGGSDLDGDGRSDSSLTQTDVDGWADEFDPDQGGTTPNDLDSDTDGLQNRIDLDSDNDGIPDNIEFQPTETYIEFSANDTDGDGIDDAYDIDNGGTALLSPFNKDGTDNPDYLDLDSDNDAVFDIDESTGLLTDSNNDGKTDGTVGQNGLDNLHGPDNFTNPNGILGGANQINSFLDLDNDYLTCATGGLDYRDAIGDDSCFGPTDDFDGDGVNNGNDLDDDNDGIPDADENCIVTGMLTYEFYNVLPTGNTVDNIPTIGADNIALTSDFDVVALQVANSPGDITEYSIRFTGDIFITNSDTYTFYLGSDDGSKLFINDVEIVDHDGAHPYSERSGSVALTEGNHRIRIEYFENSGGRQLALKYASLTNPSIVPVPFSTFITNINGCTSTDQADNNSFNLDSDDDGIPDIVEAGGTDTDNDGQVDGTFNDTDGDGWADTFDPDNGGIPLMLVDSDGDGLDDTVDLDSDNDGLTDLEEGCIVTGRLAISYFSDAPVGNTVDNIPLTNPHAQGAVINFNIPDINLTHEPSGTDSNLNFAIRFTGFINIPTTDTYTFTLLSNDGSKLYINNALVVDNDGLHDPIGTSNGNPIALSIGQHTVTLEYFYTSSASPLLGIQYATTTQSITGLPFSWFSSFSNDCDADNDGFNNRIDLDSDNDGIPDIVEAGGTDTNGDGRVDGTFTDTDGDGWANTFDPDDGGTPLSNLDSDRDQVPDMIDLDSDQDGVTDIVEAGGNDTNNDGRADTATDTDGDGWANIFDPDNGGMPLANSDTDSDGSKNKLDIDSDGDGSMDITESGGADTDNNGKVDGPFVDTDRDGWSDTFDPDNGGVPLISVDSDGDGLDDRIDLDSDNDGLTDLVEGCTIPGTLAISYFSDAPAGNTVDNIPITNPYAQGAVIGFNIPDINLTHEPSGTNSNLNFAIRFTGFINIPTTDTYTFTLLSNDGSKLYINNALVVDNDGLHDPIGTSNGNPIALSIGQHTVTLEYFYTSSASPLLGIQYATTTQSITGLPFSWFSSFSNDCDADNDGFNNRIDLDSDNDGIPDIVEAGGTDTNGDGRVDGTFTDTDGDGWANTFDPDNGGTPLANPDSDGDQVLDILDLDSDQDGVPDIVEAGSSDTNNDGRVDTATDTDNDGWANSFDSDNGGTPPANADTDGDGLRNKKDLDSDGDGIPDIIEAGGTDTDNNGKADGTYQDTDLDGWRNMFDADNGGTPLADPDTEGDGHKNRIDLDSDNDGISDIIEAQATKAYIRPSTTDTDGDGIKDSFDTDNGGTALSNPVNTDGTDNPDYLDLDSNNDGTFDIDAVRANLNPSSGQFNSSTLLNNGGSQIIFIFPGFSDPEGDFYLPTTVNSPFTFNGKINDADRDYQYSGDLDYRDNFQGVPGGVPENLQMWLRGDVTTIFWDDLSGNNVNITFTGSPALTTATNYQPAYTFNGSQSSNTSLNVNASTSPDLTVIAVYKPSQDNAGAVWGEKTSSSTNARYMIDAAGATQNQALSTGSSFEADIDALYNTNTLSLATIVYDNLETNGSHAYVNGELRRSFTSNFSGATNSFQIAASGDNNNGFNGQIAEAIVYDQLLNSGTERARIESYLALKYGITLSNDTDGDNTNFESGEGDYIVRQNSNEADLVIWDASVNSQFHNNVAGIFRNDYTNVTQKQSKSSNSDAIVTIGLDSDSNGLELSNADNPSTMSDNLALIWGHDGEALYDRNENIDFDPLQVLSRLNREWRVQENTINTQSIGQVVVQFDVSTLLGPTGVGTNDESKVVLLVDQDGDFSSGATVISQSFVVTNDNLVNFQVDFQDGNYFTLASSEDNALPVTLFSFEATDKTNTVQLDWSTTDEENSSHFTIERSKDGSTFTELGNVQASGNSYSIKSYTWTDHAPLFGNNYYRLKSHDVTGETEYSEIRLIKFSGNTSIRKPYPNPVKKGETLFLKLNHSAMDLQVQLYTLEGQKVKAEMSRTSYNHLGINTSTLKAGIYILWISLNNVSSRFKILIRE